ncbi:hypothetical protein OHC33_007581 [Knufia fluminis]|uniref:L-dopachrome isomerase n=1 Tax=Knufia fluminis TaxID=191047 RepID=A0AAN8EKD2_9EURO|nr:hypothetical protein OHC33_007581 [Knufia fluminis]
MVSDQPDTSYEQNGNGTPSTASRIRPAPVENAFPTPTPPRRQESRRSESQRSGRQSPAPGRLFLFGKSSPAPKEHKSVEALRSNVSRGGSNGLSSASELEKSWQRKELSKRTSLFFDQAFAVREPYNSARERVARDAMMLENEQTFLNDFLMSISETYHKPPTNIMITTTTDAHIIIGASTEPAYLLTLTAVSAEIASVKNMRATSRLQAFLSESLNVPLSRGVVKFVTIKEEDLGTNGSTVREEIDKLEAEEKRINSLRSRQSNRASKKSALPSTSEYGDLEQSRSDTPILLPTCIEPDEEKPYRTEVSAGKMARGKKSIMSFWKKG